jgi:hypothetical protein
LFAAGNRVNVQVVPSPSPTAALKAPPARSVPPIQTSSGPETSTLSPVVLKPVLGVGVSTLLQSGFLIVPGAGVLRVRGGPLRPPLFIALVLLGNLRFGLAGIIWALTVSEGAVLLVAVVMWFASRSAIDRGLAEGSPERAEDAPDQAEV